MTIFEEAYREQPGLKIIQLMGFGAKIFLHILVVILVSCCVKAEDEKWETDEQSVEGAPEPPGRSEETENDSYGETSHGYRDMF